jgi:hypothetical protein
MARHQAAILPAPPAAAASARNAAASNPAARSAR